MLQHFRGIPALPSWCCRSPVWGVLRGWTVFPPAHCSLTAGYFSVVQRGEFAAEAHQGFCVQVRGPDQGRYRYMTRENSNTATEDQGSVHSNLCIQSWPIFSVYNSRLTFLHHCFAKEAVVREKVLLFSIGGKTSFSLVLP